MRVWGLAFIFGREFELNFRCEGCAFGDGIFDFWVLDLFVDLVSGIGVWIWPGFGDGDLILLFIASSLLGARVGCFRAAFGCWMSLRIEFGFLESWFRV